MSEMDEDAYVVHGEQPLAAPALTEPGATAGAMLRASREAAGVSLGDLATTLKVPARKLEALEADRIDDLPDAMFVRALASSVCRALQVDARPVLERLPQSERSPFEKASHSLNTPFKVSMRSVANRPHPLSVAAGLLLRPVPIVALLLLAAAAFLLFAPPLPLMDGLMARLGRGSAATPVMPPGGTVTEDVGDTRNNVEAPGPTVAVSVPTTPAPTLAAASALSVPAAGTDLVRFVASAPSWIEVVDANGKQPLRRLLAAGEDVAVGGKPPLRVTVGRSDVVKVEVRGEPFDVDALARDNVARFEVK